MNNAIILIIVVGIALLFGLIGLTIFQSRKDDGGHVKVGNEWITIEDYKKNYLQ